VLPDRISESIQEKVWDPSEVMRDVTLRPEFRAPLLPILARHGFSIADVTVKHPYSKVEHRLTVVEGPTPALYLLHVDFRVVDQATQVNVDALARLTQLVPTGVRLRIFTGSDSQPALAFQRMVESWKVDKGIDAEFVQQRHFRETDSDDESELWDVLKLPPPDGPAVPVVEGPEPETDPVTEEPDSIRIFVSYAHADDVLFARVNVHLGGLVHSIDGLDIWTDDRIDPGDVWRSDIDQALQRATCAVLLVSADFLNSRFVSAHELPQLLDAAQSGNLKVFWLKAESGLVPPKISRYQALFPPMRPLGTLAPDDLEAALEQAMEKLLELLGPSASE
jgi:hypothetical protein